MQRAKRCDRFEAGGSHSRSTAAEQGRYDNFIVFQRLAAWARTKTYSDALPKGPHERVPALVRVFAVGVSVAKG